MFRTQAKYVARRDFSRKGKIYSKGDSVSFRRTIMRWLYARRMIEVAPAIPSIAETPAPASAGAATATGTASGTPQPSPTPGGNAKRRNRGKKRR